MSELARVEGEQQGTLCLVRVHGEVDLSNAHQVSSAIGNAMGQEARGLVVDLSDITYLDSWRTRWRCATVGYPTISLDRTTSSAAGGCCSAEGSARGSSWEDAHGDQPERTSNRGR